MQKKIYRYVLESQIRNQEVVLEGGYRPKMLGGARERKVAGGGSHAREVLPLHPPPKKKATLDLIFQVFKLNGNLTLVFVYSVIYFLCSEKQQELGKCVFCFIIYITE